MFKYLAFNRRIKKKNKNLDFLVTSISLSSSMLLEKKLDQNIVHRFFPLDLERLSENF